MEKKNKKKGHHVKFKEKHQMQTKEAKPTATGVTKQVNSKKPQVQGGASQTPIRNNMQVKEDEEAADITTKQINVDHLRLALERFHEDIEGVPVSTLLYQNRLKRLTDIAKIMQFCRQYVKQCGSQITPRHEGHDASGILDTLIEPAIDAWLTAYKEEEYLRISKAVEIDKFEALPGTHITTSVVDVAQSFMTTAKEWRCLQWQQVSMEYSARLAIEFAELADIYAHELHDSLRTTDFESKAESSDQFDLTDKVCFVINDIEIMHQHLIAIVKRREYLGLQQPGPVVKAMEEDIESQVEDIANTVAHMMQKHMAERLFAIPKALEEDMSCAFDKFTDYLLGDINRVVSMINIENQKRLLGSIRDIVMKDMLRLVKQEMKLHRIRGEASLGKDHYTELLMRCEDCFEWSSRGDTGMNAVDLKHCDLREMIQWQMEIHQLTTDEVISKYMDCKIDVQDNESCGTLTARVTYLDDIQAIQVTHLCCDDFLAVYNDGTSDVFIKMGLYPPHLFPKQVLQQTKTKVHAQREASFEDEIFQFPIPEEMCRENCTVYLHFTVFNRHRPWPVSTEEVIGEGYFKYKDLLVDRCKDVLVKLILPNYKPGLAGDIVDLLKTWSDHDKIAARFIKTQKRLEENSKGVLEMHTRERCPCFQK